MDKTFDQDQWREILIGGTLSCQSLGPDEHILRIEFSTRADLEEAALFLLEMAHG